MKILVVDDELVSRMKMKRIMDSLGECKEADMGSQAVALFRDAWKREAPFDLITLDITMPELDGTQVLQQIREYEKAGDIPGEKQAKVFMVTGQSDRNTIVSCIRAGCNDYIMKPFSLQTVMKKLFDNGLVADPGSPASEDAQGPVPDGAKRSLLDRIIERFHQGEIELPPLPKISTKFNDLAAGNAQIQDIADLLKQDPAISSKLISISNSAYYRGLVENDTVEKAISRLGLQATRQTVDALSQRSLYITSQVQYTGIIEALWEHSLACAHACQLVSESLSARTGYDLFTMGLLHDIGKLFLLRVMGEIENNGRQAGTPAAEDLTEWLEEHHCKAGGILLLKWGFSGEYIRAALHHDDLGAADSLTDELHMVSLSNELVKSMGYATHAGSPSAGPMESESAGKLGITPEMMTGIQEEVRARMEQLKDYLG